MVAGGEHVYSCCVGEQSVRNKRVWAMFGVCLVHKQLQFVNLLTLQHTYVKRH